MASFNNSFFSFFLLKFPFSRIESKSAAVVLAVQRVIQVSTRSTTAVRQMTSKVTGIRRADPLGVSPVSAERGGRGMELSTISASAHRAPSVALRSWRPTIQIKTMAPAKRKNSSNC